MPQYGRPWYKRVYDWLELRVQLEGPIKDAVLHPVPRSTASWWYVFGSASLVLLILQIVTGILLALVYTPTGADAWNSLDFVGIGAALSAGPAHAPTGDRFAKCNRDQS